MLVTRTRRSQGKYPVVFVSICDGLDKQPSIAQERSRPYFDRDRRSTNAFQFSRDRIAPDPKLAINVEPALLFRYIGCSVIT